MSTQTTSENINRLVLTLCQRDLAVLSTGRVTLIMVAPLFAELVAAVEANPVGISPHYLAALVRLRDQIDHAPPLEVVDVVRLVIPFGNYAATMGAALRSDCSPALFDAIAKGLQALAEELDADAPATAEVLHQIGDEVLELSRNTPAGRSPQV